MDPPRSGQPLYDRYMNPILGTGLCIVVLLTQPGMKDLELDRDAWMLIYGCMHGTQQLSPSLGMIRKWRIEIAMPNEDGV